MPNSKSAWPENNFPWKNFVMDLSDEIAARDFVFFSVSERWHRRAHILSSQGPKESRRKGNLSGATRFSPRTRDGVRESDLSCQPGSSWRPEISAAGEAGMAHRY